MAKTGMPSICENYATSPRRVRVAVATQHLFSSDYTPILSSNTQPPNPPNRETHHHVLIAPNETVHRLANGGYERVHRLADGGYGCDDNDSPTLPVPLSLRSDSPCFLTSPLPMRFIEKTLPMKDHRITKHTKCNER
jgi:hypothetical protein